MIANDQFGFFQLRRGFIELGELDQQAVTQIFCCYTDWIKLLDLLKDGFNFVDVDFFIAYTFENIFQRDSQITGVINGIDDRGSNSAVSVGKRCQLDLLHQVILQGLRCFALIDWQLIVNVVTAGAGWCTSGVNGVLTGIERQLFWHFFLFERVGGVQRFTVLRFAGVDFFMSVDLLKQRITFQRLLQLLLKFQR